MTICTRLLVIISAFCKSNSFTTQRAHLHQLHCGHGLTPICSNTAQFMGRKTKPSMADRRKQRAKRLVNPDLEVVRSKEKQLSSESKREPPSPPPPPQEVVRPPNVIRSKDDADEVGQKASCLLESQRRSVDSLTFIKKRIEESFPAKSAAEALASKGFFVYDGLLASRSTDDDFDKKDVTFGDELLTEMFGEGIDMLSNDNLERDITRLGEGEFVSLITGGDKYVDCPRLTEYVVCMTRHLPPLLMDELDTPLSNTASMGSIRMYDRKTKLGTAELLVDEQSEDEIERPFGVVCENNDDGRRVTAHLFISSKSWDPIQHGGGITPESVQTIGAARDRLVLLRSDTCFHRLDSWKGSEEDDLKQAGCVTVHFVKS